MKSQYQKRLYNLRKKWNTLGTWMCSACPECGQRKLFFYDKYDTISCIECNTWFSKKCGSHNCPYCSARPETPLEALSNEQWQQTISKEWRRNNYQHKVSGKIKHDDKRELYGLIKENKKRYSNYI